MIGTILSNRYELLQKIGEGGMAEVYKAKCHKLNRFDAVKILKKEFVNDEELVEKFKREATAVANLSDNNIINIFDVGTQGDINYIVMEYVRGKTLKQIIVENVRLSYERTIDIGIQIAKALDCAHRNNIIHRDVKPQNILVTEDGVVKVTDFGIAKAPTSVTITNSNKVMGSAHYFSPEQAKGSFIDNRTDLYSLGIVLYEMITGKVPYDAESPVSVALKHIQEQVIPPRHIVPGMPESLNKLILKAIEKDPIKRYQNAKELLIDLIRIQKDLNYDIIPKNVEDDFTKVMEPVNVRASENEEDESEEEENSNGVSNKTKRIIIFSLIAVMVIALGVVLGWAASLKDKKTSDKPPKVVQTEKELRVPDIAGKKLEEAKKIVEEKGLKFVIGDTEHSDKPAGTILRTFPEIGTVVMPNSEVRVRISEGLALVKVPNLVDIDVKIAQDIIKNYGLQVGNIDKEFSDTVPVDSIIRQDPQLDTQIEKNSKVNLVISQGPKTAKVPDLAGLTLTDAESALKNIKLNIGNKTPVDTADQALNGKIFMQSFEKGTNVREGTSISVSYYVYKEPAKVAIPKFVGKTIGEVKNIKEVVEKKIELIIPANTKDTDVITAQSVSEGTQVPQGTKVTISVQQPQQGANQPAAGTTNTGTGTNSGGNTGAGNTTGGNTGGSGNTGGGQ
jgi:eukaryotic-like serine/threonine-protein kinase